MAGFKENFQRKDATSRFPEVFFAEENLKTMSAFLAKNVLRGLHAEP